MGVRYQLVWPKRLFVWEGKRVLELPDTDIQAAIGHLLSEAFRDPAVLSSFNADFGARDVWDVESLMNRARAWLRELLTDESRLLPFVPPRYYAEREGHAPAPGALPGSDLAEDFARALREMQDDGYFPIGLPRECTDHPTDYADVSEQVSRAIRLPFEWYGNPAAAREWPEPVLYSVIEYFHDKAQRPRTQGYFHSHNGCGPHYDLHSSESGGAVYRWRLNAILDEHNVGLNLGRTGEEIGRLVRRFGSPLDASADKRAAQGASDPEDEVAHAIRDFRERGASSMQKRHALALLAGALESRRGRAKVVLGKDEADLFNIANNFGIRHRNDRQRTEYGDEFLDYLFGTFLSSVTLLEALERRDGIQPMSGMEDLP